MFGVLGNILTKFAPSLISWGAKKLAGTNIGRSVGNRVSGLARKYKRPLKQIMNTVQ